MTTLHMMKHDDTEDLRQAGYRRLRATSVLAAASKAVSGLQEEEFVAALARLREANFHLDRLDDLDVEIIYGTMDEALTKRVVDEFTFRPLMGNIRDLGACVGVCDLCGKGGSRDDDANEDRIRFQYLLTNTAGGSNVWTGSTCIVQHGLHVDGARTIEEAERILKKVMNQHKAQWKVEAWRAQHADHSDIPAQWEALRWARVRNYSPAMWAALGLPSDELAKLERRIYHHVRGRGKQTFRTASTFYARKAHLTESKTVLWQEVKTILRYVDWAHPLLREARNRWGYCYGNTRREVEMLDWLSSKLDEKKAIEKRSKARRSPRKL